MDKDIQLFIDGKKIEWSETPKIEFTYQTTDYTNPTVVKNTFSKTVTIEGTDTNNKIFNEIWQLDRCQDEGFLLFNPSQKVPFELFRNGEIVEKGYAKLDSVDREGYKVGYNLTLYGGLGSFFFSLDYDIGSDREKTLADLNFMGTSNPDDEFTFEIQKERVYDAWRRIGQSGNTGSWKKWDYINFAPCYNGFPENFDSNKCLMNTHGMNSLSVRYTNDSGLQYGTLPTSLTDSNGVEYTPDNGFIYGETTREMTEWETRDLRSYLQRPVLSIKGLFEALCRPENNGGYQVDLDPDFFGSGNNPYYDDAWVTLPMIDSSIITEETTEAFTWSAKTGSKVTFDRGREMTCKIDLTHPFIVTPDRLEFEVEVHAQFSGSPSAQYLYNSIANSGYFGDLHGLTFLQFYVDRDETLSLYPDRPNAVCGSNRFVLATKLNGNSWNNGLAAREMPYTDTPIEYKYGKWQKVSGSDYKWVMDDGSDTIKVTIDIDNINRIPMIAYFSKSVCNFSNMDNVYQYTGMAYRTQSSSSLSDALSKGYSYLFNDKPVNVESNAVFKGGDVTRSFQTITKRILFGGLDVTPCDWLLSYCKLFGLFIYKDKTDDIIYIRMRNNFYDGDVVDISDRLDRSQKSQITPLTFDSKWYTFNYSESESKALNDYKNLYGQDFGKQLVNTNYNFDSESVDLLDGNLFHNGATVLEKSLFFNNKYDPKNQLIPTVLYDWVKFKYYALETTYETNMALPQGATVQTLNPYMPDEYYDIMPKLQVHDRDNKGTDGEGILLFFNGLKGTGDVSYWITDDLQMMFKESDNPCWLVTQMEYDLSYEMRVAIEVKSLPDFSRYVTHQQPSVSETPTITCDWGFGRTKELYVPYYRFDVDKTPTIYENFWQAYINDLYSVDTRKVDIYVNLDTNSVYDALKRFYWFDNSIWVMTKVENYDIALDRSTKCSFTKVNDRESYLHSVTFDDYYFNFYRIGGNGNIPYSGSTTQLKAYFMVDSSSDWYVMTGDMSIATLSGSQTANAISGTAGSNLLVEAVFSPNPTTEQRSVTFYGVNMETNSVIPITVTQDAWKNSSHLILGSTVYYVPKISTGMTFMVLVYSSDPWTCSYNEPWVHSQSNSGQAGDYTVWEFTCDINTGNTERREEVWFTNGTDNDSFVIIQMDKSRGTIEQDEETARYTVPSTGGSVDYEVICDTDWVLVPSGSSSAYTSSVDYSVEKVPTTGYSTQITVAPNNSPVSRNIFFYLEYDGMVQKPTVVQLPLVQNGSGNTVLSVKADFTGDTINLNAQMPWNAYTYDNWINIAPNSGTSGETRLEYTLSANTGGYRIGYIYIEYTDEYGLPCSETFEIRQEGVDDFAVYPTAITATSTGGTYMVNVSASTPYTASTNESWITLNNNRPIAAVPFEVLPNSGETARVGVVTFGNGTATAQTVVTQNAQNSDKVIVINPTENNFPDTGGTGTFTVYCSGDWVLSTGATWLSLNAHSGNGNTIVSYSVSTNAGSARSYVVTGTCMGYSATTEITQDGGSIEPNRTITYTSTDSQVVNPSNMPYLVSNTYENGTGTIVCSRDITQLNSTAFQSAFTLETINLPASLEYIGDSAFMWCSGLTGDFTIPNSVTGIGQNAFYRCRNITSINIPDGITTIPSLGFSCMFNLTGITIPSSVTTIQGTAFDTSGLVAIDIPSSVTSIGQMAFNQNRSMTSITINNSTRLPQRCFYDCSSLTDIYCNTSTAPYISSNGQYAFENTPSGVTVHIPTGANFNRWKNDQYAGRWTYVEDNNPNDNQSL